MENDWAAVQVSALPPILKAYKISNTHSPYNGDDMILSVSRITDIPNYYSEWFYNGKKTLGILI